jgi:hypothetical protein
MRKILAAAAAAAMATIGLTACGGDNGSSGSDSGSTSIHIIIKNGTVTPNGDRVKAKVDTPITLDIDADSSGQIHVHSSPEQHIDFPQGHSTKKLTIKKPGIIDVEDHALDKVIVQLEVS